MVAWLSTFEFHILVNLLKSSAYMTVETRWFYMFVGQVSAFARKQMFRTFKFIDYSPSKLLDFFLSSPKTMS